MKKGSNRGSASVYMLCLLIPTIICVCTLIKYAQMVSAKGMLADATGLADNAVLASYNHPIMDAYGLMCYTKSESEMTGIANYYLDRSLPDNIDGQLAASYSAGGNLADNAVLLAQINKYMSRWNRVAEPVNTGKIYSYKLMVANVPGIRSRMENNLKIAASSDSATELDIPEEQVEDRKNAIAITEADDLSLAMNQVYMNYSGATSDTITACNKKISYENSISENIILGINMLSDVEDYFTPLDSAYTSWINKNQNYMLALYAYNNFSSFHPFGTTSLTGNDYDTGDMLSVSTWGENEFLINSSNDTLNNCNKVKYMIYESLFAEYIVGLYDQMINDTDVIEYAELAAGEHTAYIPVLKDEIIVGVCSKLAFEQLKKVYRYNGSCILNNYPEYIQIFDMVEVERNRDAFLGRVKHVITINAQNSPSAEAREFSFANAWTEVTVTSSDMNVETSF